MVGQMGNLGSSKDANMAQQDVFSPKDSAAFKNMMDLYNQKQYKKSLKVADALLAKHPKYGEVLSFKALLLTHTDATKQNEILELARQGLRNDLKSYLCWHVLGVVYKQRRLYKDSIKCFTMALKIDPRNDRLIRDMSSLYMELRDYSAFRKYTNIALQMRLKHYKDWMVFAFAQHMCGNVEAACKIAAEAEELFKGDYGVEPHELSSSILYRAMLMELNGMYDDCIQLLKDKENVVLDNVIRLEYIGRAAIFANKWDVAHDAYQQLICINPDNASYTLLFIATHEGVRNQKIFHIPDSGTYRNKAMMNPFLEDGTCQGNATSNQSERDDDHMVDAAVQCSEEVLDVDGHYSTSNWWMENMINRMYDRYVNRMRQHAEAKQCVTKDEALFLGCYDYPQYIKSVARTFNIKDLPDPLDAHIHDVESILEDYLKEYPIARNCIYKVHSKLTAWTRYPLFILSREVTVDESRIILDVLSNVQRNDYVCKAIAISFTTRGRIAMYHKIVEPLVQAGCLNIFKYFEHYCTFSTTYCLLVLLSKYEQNLSKGLRMDDGIVEHQKGGDKVFNDVRQHKITTQNYWLTVRIVLARIYDYIGEYTKAIDLIEDAIKRYPTSIDLYLIAGKVYRHMGNFEKSRDAFCSAYDLDKSDRQTSSKAAKALLRTQNVEESRKKWKSFLVEDSIHVQQQDPEKNGESITKKNDAPAEIKSMKYELMLAELYRSNYIRNKIEVASSIDSEHESPMDMLRKAHDIYASILEKHHEIYLNQLDFHNYCLNRLEYRTYYLFQHIRGAYGAQTYFIKATEGIFWSTREIIQERMQHKTECERVLSTQHENDNINYCLDLLCIISSQRIYHAGVYAAAYGFSDVVDVPMPFKVQCLLRAYEVCKKNSFDHNIYPMVFKMIINSEYKLYPRAILQMLPNDSRITLDLINKVFKGPNNVELTDTDAAALYIDDIANYLQSYSLVDLRHSEALIRCAYSLPVGASKVVTRIRDAFCLSCNYTFQESREHYLFLKI